MQIMNKTFWTRAFRCGLGLMFVGGTGLLGLACSDDAAEGAGPIPIDSFASELEKARCEYAVRCGEMPDAKACSATSGTSQDLLQLVADVVFGQVSFDPAAARACVDAQRNRDCSSLASALKAVNDACATVFKGSTPENGGCLVDEECVSGLSCDLEMCVGNGACCLGKCTKQPTTVSLGGDCSMNPCDASGYCKVVDDGMGNVTATCEKRVANGQPCDSIDGCESGLRCNVSGDGNCYKLSNEGVGCNPNLQEGGCVRADNYCNPTDKKCTRLPGGGQPCAETPENNKCLPYATCISGTCQTRPTEGQDCDPAMGPPCLGDLSCQMDDMLMKNLCKRTSLQEVCVLSEGVTAP